MSGFKRIGFLALLLLGFGVLPALCADRTDIITMQNGDRITGEIRKLERGRLEYKTDSSRASMCSMWNPCPAAGIRARSARGKKRAR